MIIEAIQDGQVQARDLGHLLETEMSSPLIKKVGNLEEDLEVRTKITEEANHLKEINKAIEEANHLKETNMAITETNHQEEINMVVGQETTPKVTVGPVPPQTHAVIDMRKPLQGSLHQTASRLGGMVHSLLCQIVIHVEEVGHKMEIELAANHVTGFTLHSLAGMDPKDANSLSNAKIPPQGRVPILKDVRAMLSTGVAGHRKGKELLAIPLGLPAAQMNHVSARIVVDQTAVWHSAPYLRNMSFLIGAVNYVLPSYSIGHLLITNYLRMHGPPIQ